MADLACVRACVCSKLAVFFFTTQRHREVNGDDDDDEDDVAAVAAKLSSYSIVCASGAISLVRCEYDGRRKTEEQKDRKYDQHLLRPAVQSTLLSRPVTIELS